MTAGHPPFDLDVFCQVIDHFGDAGVALRLARGLALRPQVGRVRIFCSDLPLLRLLAGADEEGVTLSDWHAGTQAAPAPVVVAAFGCDLPEPYLARAKNESRLVLHLDYLSAEPWVVGMHGLPSPYADSPLPRRFYMQSFLPGGGGVLGERPPGGEAAPSPQGPLRVLCYCYGDVDPRPLWAALDSRDQPWVVVVPAGEGQRRFIELLPNEGFIARGQGWQRRLGRVALPAFLDQRRFDRLIRWADLALVRGEDSAAQAILAGRALGWQLYRQPLATRQEKLEAFLAVAAGHFAGDDARAVFSEFHRWWNGTVSDASPGGAEGLFTRLLARREAIAAAMSGLAAALAGPCNLLDSMVYFICQHLEGESPR